MDGIRRSIKVAVNKKTAYQKFVNELNGWWPKEYTWSQKNLQEIRIDPTKDGLCTEIGPFGFRCDWGRVTELEENEYINLKWQISAKREPIPDPENASHIDIRFIKEQREVTSISFEHFDFENHGADFRSYERMMDGENGWDYILQKYKTYCEN